MKIYNKYNDSDDGDGDDEYDDDDAADDDVNDYDSEKIIIEFLPRKGENRWWNVKNGIKYEMILVGEDLGNAIATINIIIKISS